MKLKSPSLWLGVLTIGAVLYFVLSDFTRTAPGPLSAVHGREPALQGFGSCNQCHGGWFHDMREACLKCHDQVARQLGAGLGLHGHLGNERTGNCALCHGEHHGEDFAVTNKQSFALAEVPDVRQFDHAAIGFHLSGRHLDLACTRCHLHADTPFLPVGQQRYLGLQRDCAACHEDVHQGRMRLDCVECHGQDSFHVLTAVNHDKVLPLVGGHGGLGCNRCHEDGKDHSLDRVGERPHGKVRQCQDCHESQHGKPFLAANSKLLALPERQSCGGCHLPEHVSFRDQRLQLSPAQHLGSGFPLDPPHHQQKCADCHAKELPFLQRYPGRSADTCSNCHKDVHQGQFATSEVGKRGCLGCHNRLHFDPPAFGVLQHERTAFPLTGRHQDTECKRCHQKPDEQASRQFHGTKAHCADCHQDVHAGRFVTAVPGSAAPGSSGCAECHDTSGFDRLPAGGFDHARWTGFPVQGAHAQATCESCHPRAAKPDDHHRSFGRIAEHFGIYTGCVTCHRDPHQGGFDQPGMATKVEGRSGCARCHVETSFRAFDGGFDHGRWTGFALLGKHQKADCEACHAPLQTPEPGGRTWARAAGTDCASCHRDRHAGQFDTAGRTDCRRCHKTAERFADLSFRHDLDSRFPLGEQHDKLACGACHKPVRIGAVEAVRYRPIPFQCTDCHGAQSDPLHRPRVRRQ